MTRRSDTRWPIRRWAALLGLVEVALLLAALAGGGIALSNLTEARADLLDRTGPELLQANALSAALLNQETGIRGYLLTRQADFLTPYQDGRQQQAQAVAELRRLGAASDTETGADLGRVLVAIDSWQRVAAAPTMPGAAPPTPGHVDRGRTQFDDVRSSLGVLQAHLGVARDAGRASLSAASTFLTTMLVSIAGLVLLLFALLYFGFRRAITIPITRLAEEVRQVADHDIHRPVRGSGPRELVQLADDVEAMRQRIVDEVSELERAHALLDTRTHALERSNSDLEQFAYVASHDLQEPLRKVASFCQLLQRRYQGHLDERGDQYIEFAVDGAKRMQILINDLLSFSRVGRRPGEPVVLDTGKLLADALGNLEPVIAETGAVFTHGELPEVLGESSLLTAVFQNLVNNALKFHGEQPPEVHVDAVREDANWVFSVTDNGIGIETEYAERIFVIFQRLHGRSTYPGTGIGLAMCRKIVEHHGGRIWLDTTSERGTRFRFTLPATLEPARADTEAIDRQEPSQETEDA
ncbi:sensor histidine kinase [Amycolatopsis sp. H20-H5]|uniref:sensor histidine kinase n=1 Tax=Amycolatopsis sp. H20-H5 TaxID=3046309 RepID=UPI002DB83498|nr:ATP-binding protein [Amycolatopsis sp. H20-H5]MEC3982510.1 ATP-binding protein [Amycolatopsis sp. H20-H5]